MPVNVKFRDIPKSGLPTEGEWPAVVKGAWLKLSSARDSYNLEVTFEFTGPDYGGKTIRRWFNLKPSVQGIAYKFLVSIGGIKDGDDLNLVEDPKTFVLITPNIINKPCILVMGQQDDSDFSQVEDVLPPAGSTPTKASETETKTRPSLR